MTAPPISLQDLRRRIYVMAKADKTNRGLRLEEVEYGVVP